MAMRTTTALLVTAPWVVVGLLAGCGASPPPAPDAAALAPPALAPALDTTPAPTVPALPPETPPAASGARLDDMVATIAGTGRTSAIDPAEIEAPCQAPAPDGYRVPADFQVTFVLSPLAGQPAGGDAATPRRLTVAPDGRYRLVALLPPPPGSLAAPLERALGDGRVTGPGLRNLYAAVVACGFFDLEGPYFDDRRLDGSTASMRQESTQSLAITADGRRHQVVVRNLPVERFVRIRSTLFAETRTL